MRGGTEVYKRRKKYGSDTIQMTSPKHKDQKKDQTPIFEDDAYNIIFWIPLALVLLFTLFMVVNSISRTKIVHTSRRIPLKCKTSVAVTDILGISLERLVKMFPSENLTFPLLENYDNQSVIDQFCVVNPTIQAFATLNNYTPQKLMTNIKDLPTLSMYLEDNRTKIPECVISVDAPENSTFKLDPIIVLSLQNEKSNMRFRQVEQSFKGFGYKNIQKAYGIDGWKQYKDCNSRQRLLSQGELGIRDGFKKIFLNAIAAGYERVIIVENDVVFADDFEQAIKESVQSDRCGKFMFDDKTGGVLMLGASEYDEPVIRWDLEKKDLCYNVGIRTYGAFAVIYHRNVFVPIIQFLEDEKFEKSPFDHVFGVLALRGFIVRSLFPYPIVADVMKASSSSNKKRLITSQRLVNLTLYRSCKTLWDFSRYNLYRGWLARNKLQGFDFAHCNEEVQGMLQYPARNLVAFVLSDVKDLVTVANKLKHEYTFRLDGRDGSTVEFLFFLKFPKDKQSLLTREERKNTTPTFTRFLKSLMSYDVNVEHPKLLNVLAKLGCINNIQEITQALDILRSFDGYVFALTKQHKSLLHLIALQHRYSHREFIAVLDSNFPNPDALKKTINQAKKLQKQRNTSKRRKYWKTCRKNTHSGEWELVWLQDIGKVEFNMFKGAVDVEGDFCPFEIVNQ